MRISQKWCSGRSKETASLLGHHLHLPQESKPCICVTRCGCRNLRSQWPLVPLRKHPQRLQTERPSRLRNNVGAENKRVSWETKWQERRKVDIRWDDFTNKLLRRAQNVVYSFESYLGKDLPRKYFTAFPKEKLLFSKIKMINNKVSTAQTI